MEFANRTWKNGLVTNEYLELKYLEKSTQRIAHTLIHYYLHGLVGIEKALKKLVWVLCMLVLEVVFRFKPCSLKRIKPD